MNIKKRLEILEKFEKSLQLESEGWLDLSTLEEDKYGKQFWGGRMNGITDMYSKLIRVFEAIEDE